MRTWGSRWVVRNRRWIVPEGLAIQSHGLRNRDGAMSGPIGRCPITTLVMWALVALG